jgi:flagellar assembly protein FliH
LSIDVALRDAPAQAAIARKFMFDHSFDDATIVHRSPDRKPVLMKQEQIDALKKESHDAGFEAGRAAGKDEQTAQLAALLATVGANIAALTQNLDALNAEQNAQTRQLVLAIARKILPAFAATNGLHEIDALLTSTIREMAREPRLVVRVAESQFDAVDERIQTITAQLAYAGKVIVLGDATVAAGDCRIEWADGGVERNAQETMNVIETQLVN